jgi:hypothetical protein
VTVVKKDRDSISLPDSQVQKKMAESIGAQIDFLVGKRTVLKNESFLVGLKKAPFLYPIANVDHQRFK